MWAAVSALRTDRGWLRSPVYAAPPHTGSQTANGETDLVARFGGEEFSIILPLTDACQAALLAESIRSATGELRIPHPDSPTGPFASISMGIATVVNGNFTSADALVGGAADAALYIAKQRGRNRAESFEPFGPTDHQVACDLNTVSASQAAYSENVSTYTI